jgi:hypothetical protein
MTSIYTASAYRIGILGKKVDRTTATIPATTDQTIFTVTGGRIIVTSLIGEVTTAIQAQANALKVKSVPTTGTSKDISGTLDINGYEVGALVSLDGTALTTALSGTNAGAALAQKPGGIFVPIGSIKVNTAATSTGAMKWSITYIPYDDAATVAAA